MATDKPSEMFTDAIMVAGIGPEATCAHCGVMLFASRGDEMGEERLAWLRKQLDKTERYKEIDQHFLSVGHIGGQEFLLDCQCARSLAMLTRFEKMLLDDVKMIATYYRNAADALRRQSADFDKASHEALRVASLSEIDNND